MPARMAEFKYPCPGCRHLSGQCIPKPSLTEPTVGWVKCPECLCDWKIQATLAMDAGQPRLQVATLDWRQSKRHKDRIMAQRERDARKGTQ